MIIWDEAQDIPDVHFSLIRKFKDCKHVLFGDDYQTINLWRKGMSGHFNTLDTNERLPQTYRFGQSLACFVNSFMMIMESKHIFVNTISMKGDKTKKTWLIPYHYVHTLPLCKHKHILFLVRYNKTLLQTLCVYGLHIQRTHYIDCKFTRNKTVSKQFLVNLHQLIQIKTNGRRYKYPSIWWKYSSWFYILVDYEDEQLSETQKEIVAIVATQLGNMDTYIKVQQIIENNDKKKPTFELSTVHGKKGAENDVVMLANDFLQSQFSVNDFEEHCIFNTAITRTKKILYYPDIYENLRAYQTYVLK